MPFNANEFIVLRWFGVTSFLCFKVVNRYLKTILYPITNTDTKV
jgi:hypothetical protein